MDYKKYKEVNATIPLVSDGEYIATDDMPVTDDRLLRKIGYVVKTLERWNITRVRYVTYRFRSLLDLRRTESKNDGMGLILYHDRDVDTLRTILTMKENGAKDEEVFAALGMEKVDAGTMDEPSSGAALMGVGDGNKLLTALQNYLAESLLPELQEQRSVMEAIQEQNQKMSEQNECLVSQNEQLMNELSVEKELREQMQEELKQLREEFRQSAEANKQMFTKIEENVEKKRKKFLGIF